MAKNLNRINIRNPRNAENLLYKSLTKLLSGPINNYRRQGPRELKRRYLDKYKFKSASGQHFKKASYNPFDNIYANTKVNQARAERYIDFDQMEYTPEIAAALDIYADEMTTSSPLNKILKINCANEEIREILENLYFNVMNVDFNLSGWCRTLCKYGDFFMYLDIDEEIGIKNFIGLPSQEVERLEGEDKTNPQYVQFQWNSGGLTLENWQVAHFRILGNDKYAPYGTSVLDPVRRIWRQLQLQEDAMMAYRIVRSPERRVFYIEVGGIPEKDVEQHMQKVVTSMKRNQVIDQDSGQVDLRYNPMSIEEDYFIPKRGNADTTKIETLPGGHYTGDIEDVKYLRGKMIAGLKIPHGYLIYSEGDSEDKATLAQKDVRFARTIQRLQKSVVSELEKIGVVHLYILGYRGKDLVSFKCEMNNPSHIAELQELEHWKSKFEVAASATEGYFSRRWVAKNILNMTDEGFLRNIREMFFDKKLDAALAAIEQAAENAANGEGSGGDLDDLGGESESDLEANDDDQILLASPDEEGNKAPGKQNEEYTTPGAKGKMYTPELYDKRSAGARHRNIKASYADSVGRATFKNIFKGGTDLRSLAKGIFEDYESNYNKTINEQRNQEKIIIENSNQIKLMVENLDSRNNKIIQAVEIDTNEI